MVTDLSAGTQNVSATYFLGLTAKGGESFQLASYAEATLVANFLQVINESSDIIDVTIDGDFVATLSPFDSLNANGLGVFNSHSVQIDRYAGGSIYNTTIYSIAPRKHARR